MFRPHVVVVNLDTEPLRWLEAAEAVIAVGGFPLRWRATSADEIPESELVPWKGLKQVEDQRRRVATVRSYRRLMEWLTFAMGDEFVVIQDDVRPTGPFTRDSNKAVHLYGGIDVKHGDVMRRVNPHEAIHVCPKAFRVRREALPSLARIWTDESRQTCESWAPFLTGASCSFDDPPSIKDVG